jgi:hypothetical protein
MPLCNACPYWDVLVAGEEGYDLDVVRGRCQLCPPIPTGTYRADYSQWPITLGTDQCDQCRCRGCGEYTPPIPDFILQENYDYLLQETDDKFIR